MPAFMKKTAKKMGTVVRSALRTLFGGNKTTRRRKMGGGGGGH